MASSGRKLLLCTEKANALSFGKQSTLLRIDNAAVFSEAVSDRCVFTQIFLNSSHLLSTFRSSSKAEISSGFPEISRTSSFGNLLFLLA